MKNNLSSSQYEQLALEQLCKIINKIPFVSDVETKKTGFQRGYGNYIVSAHFSDGDDVQKFGLDVHPNGEKRFASAFMLVASQYKDDMCCIFAAPYISETTAKMLRDNRYSYMDLSGNCFILTSRILIAVENLPNKFVIQRRQKDYFSKSSSAVSAVLRTMLCEPKRMWQVKELSEKSKRSLGTVSNVKSFLTDREWIKEENGLFCLQNIKELLYVWGKDYHKKESLTYQYYSLDPIHVIENSISKWSASHDNFALLGGFSAGARYAPTVRYSKVNAYVNFQCLAEFAADLELKEVASGGNVIVSIPYDETVTIDRRVIHDDLVVSPVQTVLDLLGEAGRGEEAADAVIDKEFGGQ